MKAWQTHCIGVTSIVWARNRSAARWQAIRAAHDAGYIVDFTEPFRVIRNPRFDGIDRERATSPQTAEVYLADRLRAGSVLDANGGDRDD